MEHPWAPEHPRQIMEMRLPYELLSLSGIAQESEWNGPAWKEWGKKEAKPDGEILWPGGRVLSDFTFPTPSKLPDLFQTVKRNLSEYSLRVREVSRYLSIILAGNSQLSWPGPAYWNPSSSSTEKMQFSFCNIAHYQEK